VGLLVHQNTPSRILGYRYIFTAYDTVLAYGVTYGYRLLHCSPLIDIAYCSPPCRKATAYISVDHTYCPSIRSTQVRIYECAVDKPLGRPVRDKPR